MNTDLKSETLVDANESQPKVFCFFSECNIEPTRVRGHIESINHSLYSDFNWQTDPRVASVPKGSPIFVSGWIVASVNNFVFDSVYVVINEDVYEAHRFNRKEVNEALGGKNGQYLLSGFTLLFPNNFLDDGKIHSVKIVGKCKTGKFYLAHDMASFEVFDKNHKIFSHTNYLLNKYTVHPEDHILRHPFSIYADNLENGIKNYLMNGEDSAKKILHLCKELFPKKAKLSLFEFASGYGCVTRHLDKDFFDVTACDIHPAAMNFIQNSFGVKTMLSKEDPDEFGCNSKYDVVFALSFFSHMPDRTFGRWIRALYNLVNTGGALIFTTCGRISNETLLNFDVNDEGYAFSAVTEQSDLSTDSYGLAVALYPYVHRICEKFIVDTPSDFREGFWWSHQDVYIIIKDNQLPRYKYQNTIDQNSELESLKGGNEKKANKSSSRKPINKWMKKIALKIPYVKHRYDELQTLRKEVRVLRNSAIGNITVRSERDIKNEFYSEKFPSINNAIEIFDGKWTSILPIDGVNQGWLNRFECPLIKGWNNRYPFLNKKVLELGPLEGGHTALIESFGAQSITAIEASSIHFLKCLIVKDIFALKANFLHGDFKEYLRNCETKYDVVVASGVLYHMVDPVQLINDIAKVADTCFIWTHYYSHERTDIAHLFDDEIYTLSNGFNGYKYNYPSTDAEKGFLGGTRRYSIWMQKDNIISTIKEAGFSDVSILDDGNKAPGGNHISLHAHKKCV